MAGRNLRYNDYYLVNDEDMISEDDIVETRQTKKCSTRILVCVPSILFLSLASLSFIVAFIILPIVFMNNVTLQQTFVFTRWNLERNKTFYSHLRYPAYKNHYILVNDLDNTTILQLGLWHILPFELAETALNNATYDFDEALLNSNYSVLLYFHGTGEDRSQSLRKYQLFRYFFHVIAFDYRGYGDSSDGDMFESNVVNDCVQIYKWVRNRTNSAIYVWGHSLGTALATNTLAHLGQEANVSGLVLEAAFTTFTDELYHHPYVKYFKWLPWFEDTIVKPLIKNGFIFNTAEHIYNVKPPIMFLHALDDEIVPYSMSEQLYNLSEKRNISSDVKIASELVLFDRKLGLNHYFIYQDPYVIFYIKAFQFRCSMILDNTFNNSSHQS